MNISVTIVSWQSKNKQLKQIRENVFIKEQKVPVELEWDGLDEQATHVLAELLSDQSQTEKLAIGTARIIIKNKQAHIGRMAVLTDWRAQGIGSNILQYCINHCRKNNIEQIVINAQVYVTKFYQQAGFKTTGKTFSDAGIAHKQMTMTL